MIKANRPYKRSDRIADEIQHILSHIFINQFRIPEAGLLTVTSVKITKDLRICNVYISFLAPKQEPLVILDHVIKNSKKIRFCLGNKLKSKYVPELKFYYDDTLKKAEKINIIMNKVNQTKSPEDIK